MVVPFGKITGIARLYVQTWDEERTSRSTSRRSTSTRTSRRCRSRTRSSTRSTWRSCSGSYATLGLAEDTWALNERVIDEEAFLEQAWLYCEERKQQLWDVLAKTKQGFVTVVFDTSDRISHMFYRYLDPAHPAQRGQGEERHKRRRSRTRTRRMDELVGELRAKLGATATRS